MSAEVFYLPDLGEGLIEATVLSWLVAPGDHVTDRQPIVEVETTKSSVEIPAGFAGTIEALYAEPADVVRVGQPLFSFTVDAQDDSPVGIVGTAPKSPTAKPARRIRLRPPEDD